MAKNNNLTDFLTDVADAIREKKGTTEKINPQDFSDEIKSIKTSSSFWTGHVDVEGLKAIGWDDDDIAYFQEHGVNWMEEDDEYHKVPEDNKALYGVINYSNYKDYKDVIVYLPKFDMSNASGSEIFRGFRRLAGLPLLNLPNLTHMWYAFCECDMLPYIIPLDTNKVTSFNSAFRACESLVYVPYMDTRNVKDFMWAFGTSFSLCSIPDFNYQSANNITYMFGDTRSMRKINVYNITNLDVAGIVNYTYCLLHFKIDNLASNLSISSSAAISKESVLYIISNEAATSEITITLHAAAYARLSTDPDIVEALENHTLVSLASA